MAPEHHHHFGHRGNESPEEELAEDHRIKEGEVLEREGLETELMDHDESGAGETVGDVEDLETPANE